MHSLQLKGIHEIDDDPAKTVYPGVLHHCTTQGWWVPVRRVLPSVGYVSHLIRSRVNSSSSGLRVTQATLQMI